MDIVLLLLALLGHAVIWVAFYNRVHSTGMSYRLCRIVGFTGLGCMGLIALWLGVRFGRAGWTILDHRHGARVPWPVLVYLGVCWIAAVASVVWWIWRHLIYRPPKVLRYHRRQLVDVLSPTPACEQQKHHFLVRLPGNQTLQLDVAERALEVPRLAAALDRLSIVHLSDFHFTGRVGKAYFQELVRLSNQLEPDLVAITGDVVDHPDYIHWIPDTLGKLTSRYGAYFVLGNHDVRADTPRIRRTLTDLGLVDVAARWIEIRVRGAGVVLAGNELPWFAPAADMQHAPPCSAEGGPLRIALSHSPDQLHWAQANQVDLLLAGHTHGGQIRFPLIGPIFSPSRKGVKYASGIFHAPPTIMHVSRGVSGEFPIRMNCPPEMARLILHAKSKDEGPGNREQWEGTRDRLGMTNVE